MKKRQKSWWLSRWRGAPKRRIYKVVFDRRSSRICVECQGKVDGGSWILKDSSLYGESLHWLGVGVESMVGLVEKVSCVIFCLKFGPSFFANLQKNSHSFHNYCREVRESSISADARCRSANGIVENQYVVLQLANKDDIARVAEKFPSRRFSTLKPKKDGKIAGGKKVARIGIEPSGQWCWTTRAAKYVVSFAKRFLVHYMENICRVILDKCKTLVEGTNKASLLKQAILRGISVWRIFDLDC